MAAGASQDEPPPQRAPRSTYWPPVLVKMPLPLLPGSVTPEFQRIAVNSLMPALTGGESGVVKPCTVPCETLSRSPSGWCNATTAAPAAGALGFQPAKNAPCGGGELRRRKSTSLVV